jgi:hypothetical protein
MWRFPSVIIPPLKRYNLSGRCVHFVVRDSSICAHNKIAGRTWFCWCKQGFFFFYSCCDYPGEITIVKAMALLTPTSSYFFCLWQRQNHWLWIEINFFYECIIQKYFMNISWIYTIFLGIVIFSIIFKQSLWKDTGESIFNKERLG